MKVKVKPFAIFRDIIGKAELTLEFDSEISVDKLINYLKEMFPDISTYIDEYEIEPVIVLVNGRPATEKTILRDGDEVAFFPPAAGGISEGKVITRDVNIEKIIQEIRNVKGFDKVGAMVIFIGFVKGIIGNRKVYRLSYEAYEPYASKKLQEIASDLLKDDKVVDVRIYHKVANLKPGETTIYIMVSAIDRNTALETARRAIERVKREAPIWKLEVRENGEYWVIGDGKHIPRPMKNRSKAKLN